MKKKLEATVQVRNYTNKQIKIKTIKMIKSQKKINKMGMIFVTYLKLRILIKDQNLACKLLISTLYKKKQCFETQYNLQDQNGSMKNVIINAS